MTKIITGVDGSASGASALRWAVEEGLLHGWSVQAALTWGLLDQHHVQTDAPFDPDYCTRDARDALIAYVYEAVEDAVVDLRTVNDLPARGLLRLAKDDDAALLVVGARGRGSIRSVLLGSVSYECVHRSSKPIAVIRAGMAHHRAEGPQRIVVGIDGSANSRVALDWAVAEASLRDAELEVVHAWSIPYVGADLFGAAPVDTRPFESSARTILADAVAGVDTSALHRGLTSNLALDSPTSAILAAAKDADLVVVGTRGVGGFAGLLLGSTSNQVVHHAPCPVVVVPGRA
jgi:nucleotide-binding universal stress UspA family protein